MPNGIIAVGLNGSGKTTIGRELAKALNYKNMYVEDYYFLESEIPYTISRTKEEVRWLILTDIRKKDYFVTDINNWMCYKWIRKYFQKK